MASSANWTKWTLTKREKLYSLKTALLGKTRVSQTNIRAGYSKNTAKDIGCENLAKPNIADWIDPGHAELNIYYAEKLRNIGKGLSEGAAASYKTEYMEVTKDAIKPEKVIGAELAPPKLEIEVMSASVNVVDAVNKELVQ